MAVCILISGVLSLRELEKNNGERSIVVYPETCWQGENDVILYTRIVYIFIHLIVNYAERVHKSEDIFIRNNAVKHG